MNKRQSLTARFAKVLGRQLPGPNGEETHADGTDAQASSSRRREQVLQAQRTHRHRTQQYIRELEKEVFRLRDENEELQEAMARMQLEMARMSAALAGSGVPFESSPNPHKSQPDSGQNTLDPSLKSNFNQQTVAGISIDLTGLAKVVPQGSCEVHPAETSPPTYQPASETQAYQLRYPPSTALAAAAVEAGNCFDDERELTAKLGINFILDLESPCLQHVKHAHMDYTTGTIPQDIPYNSGPGHLLNVSAMLTHRYSNRDLESQPLTMPSTELERLLDMSTRLRLDYEVTPVQIWMRIQEVVRPRNLGIDKGNGNHVSEEVIGKLLLEFRKYVYCNSFGAVVEKGTAQMVLADVLGVHFEL